jgi:hypothetical protein
MPSPSTTAPSLGAASFPGTGPYSCLGAPAPAGTKGGSFGQTQVTRLVDTRWARAAVDAATGAAMVLSSTISCGAAGAAASAGISGSLYQNPSAGYAEGSLDPGPSSDGAFDLAASGGVVSSMQSSLLASASTLGITVGLQSVVGGYAECQANAASASFLLVEAAISAPTAALTVSYLLLAGQVSLAAAASAPLFSAVIGMVSQGLIGAGSSIIGMVLSGSLGQSQSLLPAVNLLMGIPAELVAISAAGAALVSACLGAGVSLVLPTSASAGQFLSLFPPGLTGVVGGALSIGAAVAALDKVATAAVNSAISSLIPAAAAPTAAQSTSARPSAGTNPRLQGTNIVDGYIPVAQAAVVATPQQNNGTVLSAAAAIESLLLAALALFSGSSPLSGLGSPGTYPPGSLGGAGLFSPSGSGGAQLSAGSQAARTASATAALAAAAVLGATPPTVGDLQDAGFAAASGNATTTGGLVTSLASDPAAATSVAASMLADGCAFGAALSSALSQAAGLVSAAGTVSATTLASLDDLQTTLQCRKASYASCSRGAYAAARIGSSRYTLMVGAAGLLGGYGNLVPNLCPPGSGPASCL